MADALLTAPPEPTAPASPPPGGPTPPAAPVSPAAPAPTDWRATLPPDLQAHKGLEKFKDSAALARSYVQMEAYQGRSVVIPGADAKPEERAAFDAKINAARGVPAEADAYEIAAPEGAPELDASAVGQWKGVFHRLGLTPDQAKGLTAEFFGSPMGNPAMAGEAMQAHTVQLLRNEWGGSYDHNLKMASVGARTVLGPEFVALMEQTGLGNHPVILKACLRLGKDRREAGMMPTDAKTGGILGPEDAQTRITELMQTPEYRRGDRATVDEVQRLFQLKHS